MLFVDCSILSARNCSAARWVEAASAEPQGFKCSISRPISREALIRRRQRVHTVIRITGSNIRIRNSYALDKGSLVIRKLLSI